MLSIISGVVAGIALILLAVMDTFRYHEEHAVLLLVCFLGLGGSAWGSLVVFWGEGWSPDKRLRYSYVELGYPTNPHLLMRE